MTLRGESLFTATIYLCNNESRENSIIKVAQKNIYIYYVCFLGTIGCSSPTKLHTFGDLHSIINLPAALSAFGCSCPLNDTRNRSFSEGRGDSME